MLKFQHTKQLALRYIGSPMISQVLPFACFMAFIAIQSMVSWGWDNPKQIIFWTYPIRTLLVAGLLVVCWSSFSELKEKLFSSNSDLLLSAAVGILVYLAWVQMDWPWAMQGKLGAGYNPFEYGSRIGLLLAGIRLISVSVVVPMMEEIFWRSFLIRYVISPDFTAVPLGHFTAKSFLVSIALFGAEHNLWLAGVMAGAAYTLLLYKTGRLWPCVIAHGVTNFLLAIHVLLKEDWAWW